MSNKQSGVYSRLVRANGPKVRAWMEDNSVCPEGFAIKMGGSMSTLQKILASKLVSLITLTAVASVTGHNRDDLVLPEETPHSSDESA